MTIPSKAPDPKPPSIEDVLMRGDLSSLTQDQRLEYYNRVCQSLGLNPLTRPFDYLTLNGKLTLYARRDAADQLRKINGISVEIVSQDFANGLLAVHVRAKDKDGRSDEDVGVVALPETARGEIAANLHMKAVTKAKRRVTLSLSGLGFLDETEVADIPPEAKKIQAPEPTYPTDKRMAPHLISMPDKPRASDWIEFGELLLAGIDSSQQEVEAEAWIEENRELLDQMSAKDFPYPKVEQRLSLALLERKSKHAP